MSSYLELAIAVLRKRRWPLTAREILAEAKSSGMMPVHLYGPTQHKTLNARLSEHIRMYQDRSQIYRVAPATYFLTEFQSDPQIPPRFRKQFQGVLRYKQVRHENVLVFPTDKLNDLGVIGFIPVIETIFCDEYASLFGFLERKRANSKTDLKQFISYTILMRDDEVLSYTRGKFTSVSKDLKGARSIGFGGHINEGDFDLFSGQVGGIFNSARRELFEEIGIVDDMPIDPDALPSNLKILGLLNIDDTPDARKHVAVVSAYRPRFDDKIEGKELSINNVSWINVYSNDISFSEFEPWSAFLLHAMRAGMIRIGEIFRGVNW